MITGTFRQIDAFNGDRTHAPSFQVLSEQHLQNDYGLKHATPGAHTLSLTYITQTSAHVPLYHDDRS